MIIEKETATFDARRIPTTKRLKDAENIATQQVLFCFKLPRFWPKSNFFRALKLAFTHLNKKQKKKYDSTKTMTSSSMTKCGYEFPWESRAGALRAKRDQQIVC